MTLYVTTQYIERVIDCLRIEIWQVIANESKWYAPFDTPYGSAQIRPWHDASAVTHTNQEKGGLSRQ